MLELTHSLGFHRGRKATNVPAPPPVTPDPVDIELFLVTGQSNAHGSSRFDTLTTAQKEDITDFSFHSSWHSPSTSNATDPQYYLDVMDYMQLGKTRGEGTDPTLASEFFGIEWGFAKHLKANYSTTNEIGIVKYGVGASTIDDNPNFSDWDTTKTNECFQGLKNTIADAITKFTALNYNIIWKGFLWYQGESNGGNNPATYQAHLENLISEVEQELGVTNLPCTFCAPAQQQGLDMRVNEAFQNLARTKTNYDFIKISDHHDGTYNDVHLSGPNMYDAGLDAGSAMIRAVTNTASTFSYFSPSSINSPLWLDLADTSTLTESGGIITGIADKSGSMSGFGTWSGSTITAISNGLNGKNILRFDNNSDATSHGNITLQSNAVHKWFLVMKATGADANDGFFKYRSSNPSNEVILFNFSGAGQFKAEWYINSGTSLRGNTTNLLNSWNILSVELDVPNVQASAWLNGTAYNTNIAQGISNFPSIANGQIQINRYANIGGSDWAEVVFAENITQEVSDKIEGYLAIKWGLDTKLPASHPYKYYHPSA